MQAPPSWNATAARAAVGALVIIGIFLTAGALRDRLEAGVERPPVAYETPTLRLDDTLNVTVTLRPGPSDASGTYTGTGAPYVLATFHRDAGGLQHILNYAEATPVSNVGVDLCTTPTKYLDFYLVAPIGGAVNATTNATYASQGYEGNTPAALPGGDRCALRVGVDTTWRVLFCAEGDGRLDQPKSLPDGSTLVDAWDICVSTTYHGSLKTPGRACTAWPTTPSPPSSPRSCAS